MAASQSASDSVMLERGRSINAAMDGVVSFGLSSSAIARDSNRSLPVASISVLSASSMAPVDSNVASSANNVCPG